MIVERTQEEIEKDIKQILEDKIKPAVASHGGIINFLSFDNGVARLEMAGSCSGCAMSKATLQNSVEGMMTHYIPEVKSIIGEDDEQAAAGGYTPYYPNSQKVDFT